MQMPLCLPCRKTLLRLVIHKLGRICCRVPACHLCFSLTECALSSKLMTRQWKLFEHELSGLGGISIWLDAEYCCWGLRQNIVDQSLEAGYCYWGLRQNIVTEAWGRISLLRLEAEYCYWGLRQNIASDAWARISLLRLEAEYCYWGLRQNIEAWGRILLLRLEAGHCPRGFIQYIWSLLCQCRRSEPASRVVC